MPLKNLPRICAGKLMRSLGKKLLRDLWKMKGQALAISMVIASGVSAFVMLISNMNSLNLMKEKFYQEYRFAEVFGSLKRAPESLRLRINQIHGVKQVETRIVGEVKLDIRNFPEPVTARLVSLPDNSDLLLNKLYIRKGRIVAPLKDNEVVISEAFADAHSFKPGDSFGAVINGKWKTLIITGIALSPEFVIQSRPGALSPDYKRYGILWMGRDALAAAYDMKGAFNDVVLTVSDDTKIEDVIMHLDNILAPYGGLGSYSRENQISHRFLTEEFKQLKRSAEIFPSIFIAVSAFLLNVVIARIISLQREQIATLKAFGYSNLAIGMHYMKMVAIIVFTGVAAGTCIGGWLGRGLSRIYTDFFRFPSQVYELNPAVVAVAALVTAAAALTGTLYAVRKAAKLPPAEAMQPEPPAGYKKIFVKQSIMGRLFSQPARIIIRNVSRTPLKSFFTVTGIALSCAIMIAGTFSKDAVDFMVDVQFRLTQKEDITVAFTEPVSKKALYEIKSLKGVEYAEPLRAVPVRLGFGHKSYRTSILGIEPGNVLHLPLDINLKPLMFPSEGIILNDYLGAILGVSAGDMLTVEVLEGSRPLREVPVVGLVKQYIGVQGYMALSALNRMMREGSAISGAYLSVDPLYQNDIYRKLINMPHVAGAVARKDEIRNFYETQAEYILFFTFVATILAGTIAFGVVYNSARISLGERSRELASLRVLGYTKAEISYIFLGELGIMTIAAIPLGFILGRGLCIYIAEALGSDLFRIPVVIEPATYSLAASVVAASACLSGIIVRRKLDRLDLVAVLKTKE